MVKRDRTEIDVAENASERALICGLEDFVGMLDPIVAMVRPAVSPSVGDATAAATPATTPNCLTNSSSANKRKFKPDKEGEVRANS
jgi:hypothetical protein